MGERNTLLLELAERHTNVKTLHDMAEVREPVWTWLYKPCGQFSRCRVHRGRFGRCLGPLAPDTLGQMFAITIENKLQCSVHNRRDTFSTKQLERSVRT